MATMCIVSLSSDVRCDGLVTYMVTMDAEHCNNDQGYFLTSIVCISSTVVCNDSQNVGQHVQVSTIIASYNIIS